MALLPTPGAIPTTASRPARRAPPEFTGWEDEAETTVPGDLTALAASLKGGRPVADAEEVGFFSNVGRNILRNAGEVGVGLANVVGADEAAKDFRNWYQDQHGYQEQFSLDDVEKAWAEGRYAGVVKNVLGFAVEHGVGSLPWWLGAINPATMIATAASMTGLIAEERAQNNNRDHITFEDIKEAAPAGILSVLSQRLGLGALTGKGALAARPAQSRLGAVGKAAKTGAVVSAEEAAQEVIEELGATVGTEQGVTREGLRRAALGGALAGGPLGAAGGAVTGAMDVRRARQTAIPDDEAQAIDEAQVSPPAPPLPPSPATETAVPPVVPVDEAQAVAEAQPTPEPLAVAPGVRAEDVTTKDVDSLQARAQRSVTAVNDALADYAAGKFDPDTFNGLRGPNLYAFGARVGYDNPNVPYSEFTKGLSNFLKSNKRFEEVQPKPGSVTVEPSQITPETPRVPTTEPLVQANLTEALSEPGAITEVGAKPAPAKGKPKRAAKPKAPPKGPSLAAARTRAGELGVDARGSREAILSRITKREAELAEREGVIKTATFEPYRGAVGALESRAEGEGYSVAESTLREGTETLRHLAAKPARDRGKGRKRTTPLTKREEGARKAEAQRAARQTEDARSLELLHAELATAPTPEAQLDVLNRAAPILERHTGQVNKPGDNLVDKLKAIRASLVEQRPKETRTARQDTPPQEPAPTEQIAPARPAPAIRKKRLRSRAAIAREFVGAVQAVATPDIETRSAEAIREEASTLVDQVLVPGEGNRRVMAPQLAQSGAPAETIEELRRATARLRSMASSRQAKSKMLEQTAYVRELMARTVKDAAAPPVATRPREDPEAQQRETVQQAELDALIAEQEAETAMGEVIEQETERFTPEELAMLTYREGLSSELEDVDDGMRQATPEQNARFAENLQQKLGTRSVLSTNELLDAFSNAQAKVPGQRAGLVRALQPLVDTLRRMNMSDVNVVLDPDMRTNGRYNHNSHTVLLNPNLIGTRPYAFFRAAMHELVHAATARQLLKRDKLAQQVEAIREYVQSIVAPVGSNPDMVTGQTYGLLDAYEFLAEGLSNPVFQQQLNDVVLPVRLRVNKRFKSVWDNLVDLVRRALGFAPRTHSALDGLLQAASPMLTGERYRRANQIRRLQRPEQFAVGTLDNAGRRVAWSPLQNQPGDVSNLIDAPEAALKDRAPGVVTRKRMQAALWAVPRDVILKTFRRYFVDPNTGRNPLEDVVRHIRDTAGTYHLRWGKDAALIRRLNEMTGSKGTNSKQARQMQSMYRMAVEATMGGVHPDKAWNDPDNVGAPVSAERAQGREALHQRLHTQWNKLGKNVQDQYLAMQKKLERTYFELRRETLRFQGRIEGIDNEVALARIGNMRDLSELDQIVIDHDLSATTANRIAEAFELYSSQVAGPYFPLRRMGDYVAYGTKDLSKTFNTDLEAAEYIDQMRNEYPGATLYANPQSPNQVVGKATYMSQVDSLKDAENIKSELERLGFAETGAGLKRSEPLPANTPLHDLLRVAQERGHDPSVISAMREALMALLPEARQLRASLRRAYVEGASTNMLQSFSQHLTASHRAVAHLQHSHEIQTAYQAAENLITAREKADPHTATKMRMVIDELHDRQASVQEGQAIGRFDVLHRRIGQLAFSRFLLDGSYLILNSTQTLLVTFPQLAGQYGARKAINALYNAYLDTTPRITRSIKQGGARSWVDPSTLLEDVKRDIDQSTRLSQTERTTLKGLFERAQQQGVLNSLQSEEMVAIGRGESKFDRFMRAASGPAQYVEFMNRLVTLHAAFNIARDSGVDVDRAIEDAIEHTRETHFDYSVENRPRWAHHGVGRLFGVFKMHAMGMMFRLGDYTMKLTRPGDRKEGMRQLMFMMATHGALAGALGSIMSEPIRWALWMMGLVWDDEDDVTEFLDDPDIAIRETLHDWLGEENDEIAAWITDGMLPSIGSRVSLGSMFFRDVPDAASSAQNILEKSIMGTVGAPGAYAIDITKGIAHMQEGDWNKAFQKMVPVKLAANLARAYELNTQGVTDRNGNLLVSEDQFGFWEVLGQAIGFTPAKKQQIYMAREVKYKREKAAQQRATLLRQRYYRAERADRRNVWKEIQAFNRKNPAERITVSSLRRGLQRRRKQERGTVRGVYFHGRERQRYYNRQTEFSTLD